MNIACFISSDKVFEALRPSLSAADLDYERLSTEKSISRAARHGNYDLLLVEPGPDDLSRDGIFSWMTCRLGEGTPVIMLSLTPNPELVASSLEAGADDYLKLPLDNVELVARIQAVMRRRNPSATRRIIELMDFAIDMQTRIVTYKGEPVALTPREFTMAWLFFSAPGVFISRETLGSAIWGVDSEIAGRTIEQHVYKLRKKLQLGMDRNLLLRTAYNQGYRLELCGDRSRAAMEGNW
ncbi:MAG TPA: response regulator transcription factor [Burkholderiaceae bacterium]